MSHDNVCSTCGAMYGDHEPHTCDPKDLADELSERLNERIDELEKKVDERITALEQKLATYIEDTYEQFRKLEERVGK